MSSLDDHIERLQQENEWLLEILVKGIINSIQVKQLPEQLNMDAQVLLGSILSDVIFGYILMDMLFQAGNL